MINETIGWFGAIFFAVCALPQVIKTWKTKKADDLSWLFLFFWLMGEIFTITYIVVDDFKNSNFHYPLYINYGFNTLFVFYLFYAKKKYSGTGSADKQQESEDSDAKESGKQPFMSVLLSKLSS